MNSAITFGQYNLMTPSVASESSKKYEVTPETQNQERAWALAAQRGDSTAFIQIVDAYQRPVYNLCYRMLGDANEAEDAAQETFLRAYTKLNTYNPHHKLSSWLLSIASHYCIDRLRKQRYQIVSWDDLPPWRWLPDSAPQPEEVTLKHESHDTLHDLLERLPADYRAVTILRYWHEMSYDEIARTLNTSVSAIKSRLFRARHMLADAVQQAELQASASEEHRPDSMRMEKPYE